MPHRQRTIQRMAAQQTVLCLQDGSDLSFSNLDKCEGLGVIGTNQTGTQILCIFQNVTYFSRINS